MPCRPRVTVPVLLVPGETVSVYGISNCALLCDALVGAKVTLIETLFPGFRVTGNGDARVAVKAVEPNTWGFWEIVICPDPLYEAVICAVWDPPAGARKLMIAPFWT